MKWINKPGSHALLYTWMENIVTFRTIFKCWVWFWGYFFCSCAVCCECRWNQLTGLMSIGKIVFQISELTVAGIRDWLVKCQNHLSPYDWSTTFRWQRLQALTGYNSSHSGSFFNQNIFLDFCNSTTASALRLLLPHLGTRLQCYELACLWRRAH